MSRQRSRGNADVRFTAPVDAGDLVHVVGYPSLTDYGRVARDTPQIGLVRIVSVMALDSWQDDDWKLR